MLLRPSLSKAITHNLIYGAGSRQCTYQYLLLNDDLRRLRPTSLY